MAGPKDGVAPVWSNYHEQGVVAGDWVYPPRVEILSDTRFLLLWVETTSVGGVVDLALYVRLHNSSTMQPLGSPQLVATASGMLGMVDSLDFQTVRMATPDTVLERVVVQFSSYKQADASNREYRSDLVLVSVAGTTITVLDFASQTSTAPNATLPPTTHLVANSAGSRRQLGEVFWTFHCWPGGGSEVRRYDVTTGLLVLGATTSGLGAMPDVVGVTINENKGTIVSHQAAEQGTFVPDYGTDAINSLELGKSWPSWQRPRRDGGRLEPNGDPFFYPFHTAAPDPFNQDEPIKYLSVGWTSDLNDTLAQSSFSGLPYTASNTSGTAQPATVVASWVEVPEGSTSFDRWIWAIRVEDDGTGLAMTLFPHVSGAQNFPIDWAEAGLTDFATTGQTFGAVDLIGSDQINDFEEPTWLIGMIHYYATDGSDVIRVTNFMPGVSGRLRRRPLRQFPRSDGLGMSSALRQDGNRSMQASLRRGGGTYY